MIGPILRREGCVPKHVKARIEHGEPGGAALYRSSGKYTSGATERSTRRPLQHAHRRAANFSAMLLVSSRTTTTQMKVHFLGSVSEGRIPCRGRAPRSRGGDCGREGLRRRENLVRTGTGA